MASNGLISKRNTIIWGVLGVIVTLILLIPVFFPNIQKELAAYLTENPTVAPIVVILGRFIGIVVAPLPGAPLSFASIAVLPWWQAWIYNLIGVELGAIVAFLLARVFREKIAAKFVPLQQLHAWQEKVDKSSQFWGFVALRMTSSVAFDFVSYASGLTKLSFRTFFLATLLVDIPTSLLFFYFGGIALRYSIYFFIGFVVLFLLVSASTYWQSQNKQKLGE